MKLIAEHIKKVPKGRRAALRKTANERLMKIQKEYFKRLIGKNKLKFVDLKKLLVAKLRF